MPNPTPSTYRMMLRMLTPHEKRRGALVLALVIVMALFETAGVASVLPFLAVLGDPAVVQTNPILQRLYALSGLDDVHTFLFALGLASFAMVVVAAVFRTLTTYAINRYTSMRRHALSERLLETYLRQPYAFFLNRHSGDMAKNILSEVDQVLALVFTPGLQAIANSVVAFALISLLVAIDPWLALGVGLSIGTMYMIVYILVQGMLGRIGEERLAANRERYTAAGEALSGIKDIKLLGREYAYLSRFRPASLKFARTQATTATLAEIPKFLIEAVAVGGILGLALVLMTTREGIGEVLPVLGLYAFAGYKLLPAGQRIYECFAKTKYGASAVEEMYRDLKDRERLAEIAPKQRKVWAPSQEIRLRDVSFRYAEAPGAALSNIELCIPVGTAVGIVGGTGAGKTTMVDIILGLLRPSSGEILVDGTPVDDDNLRTWQNALGYVPQNIFLTDTSIAENIALGVPPSGIDQDRVVRCAQMAQIHGFIASELPRGYDTMVGERGVRLSGGQRQRIGIARALYHKPSVLVLDEATSALDAVTERAVVDAIHAMGEDHTVIVIAHRISTVRGCSAIFLLEHGQVVAKGSYDELIVKSEEFRALASV